ncbi:hypothetical protein VTJ04DRAFT_6543 [Mycothermus thermophilus]|uniref:uncharacterized protein n=1 Tax=Humicola insolens TaxID=85995 RepID=UPI00374400B1
MATDSPSTFDSWYNWLFPDESHYILRLISSFFITLALAPIIPIVLMFFYDVGLWLWRILRLEFRRRYAQIVSAAESHQPGRTHETT